MTTEELPLILVFHLTNKLLTMYNVNTSILPLFSIVSFQLSLTHYAFYIGFLHTDKYHKDIVYK